MIANKYKIVLTPNSLKELKIPVEMNWDFLGRSNDLEVFEERTIKEVLNSDKDFEVARFAHDKYSDDLTAINYEFYFVPTATTANVVAFSWDTSYVTQGFTEKEIYYFSNSFKRSFFKLDFYDSPSQSGQTNYFTVILPTQQGVKKTIKLGTEIVQIVTPVFNLDFLGDKEGFFLYWLKKREFINKNVFYMTAKFFDAKTGIYTKMMNRRQDTIGSNNLFNFNGEEYFYYKVVLDYNNFTYRVFDVVSNLRVGTNTDPIKWYEYVNPI